MGSDGKSADMAFPGKVAAEVFEGVGKESNLGLLTWGLKYVLGGVQNYYFCQILK